ncbi:MAG: hypothetical protein ABIK89_24975, partial [Planctomycetota bacterium]
ATGYLRYRTDLIFGVRWFWRWEGSGIEGLTGLCPTCRNEIHPEKGYMDNEYQFACSRCGGLGQSPPACGLLPGEVVEKEIRRRVRAGEWRAPVERFGDDNYPGPKE